LSGCQSCRDLERFCPPPSRCADQALGLGLRRPPTDSPFRYLFPCRLMWPRSAAAAGVDARPIPGVRMGLEISLVCDGKTSAADLSNRRGGGAFHFSVTLYTPRPWVWHLPRPPTDTRESHERAVLREPVGHDGSRRCVLIQADALHTQKPFFFRQLTSRGPTSSSQ